VAQVEVELEMVVMLLQTLVMEQMVQVVQPQEHLEEEVQV
jgi:hypothetical protein